MYQLSHSIQDIPSNTTQVGGLTDIELVVLSKRKDLRAFEQLVKRYRSSIRAHIYQLAPDSNERSDLEQEVMIRIWRHIEKLKNPASFRSWVRQIATNVFYDTLRKKPDLKLLSLDEPFNDADENSTRDIEDISAMPDDLMQRAELFAEIQKALASLPATHRTAVVLREVHGLSYDEIASLTKTQKGTVKSRISRARDKVQFSMAAYVQDCA